MPESGNQYVPLDGSSQPNWVTSMLNEPGHRKKMVIFSIVAIVALAAIVGSIIYVKYHGTPVNPDQSITTTAPGTSTTPRTTTTTRPTSTTTTTESPTSTTTTTTPPTKPTTSAPSSTTTTVKSTTTAKSTTTTTPESLTSTTGKPHPKPNKHFKNTNSVDDEPRDVINATSEAPSEQEPSKTKDDGVFY